MLALPLDFDENPAGIVADEAGQAEASGQVAHEGPEADALDHTLHAHRETALRCHEGLLRVA